MRIVLTGGGSGGHLSPLLAVKRKLKEKLANEVEFLYIGSGAKIERDFMEREGISAKYIRSGKMRRYFSFQNFIDIVWNIPVGFLQSLWYLLWYMPDAIFSKGGYVSFPVVLAAWIYRIPVMVHESDAIPGIANQILSKFANRIAVAYPSAKEYFPAEKTALVGNPVREEITTGDAILMRRKLGFTENRKTILVLGGSQGAKVINEAICLILVKLLDRYQVIHQTGEKNYEDVVRIAAEFGIKAGREGYYPAPFLEENVLRDAFALADIVISRAGANSIAEIAANKKPSILIPIEKSANNHQVKNAYELAKIGATTMLEENNLHEHILLQKIGKILEDESFRNEMINNIQVFYHPKAAEVIANGLIEMTK